MGTAIPADANTEELFTWTDELSVGIEEIDEQHKVLVDLLNELHRGIMEKHGSEVTIEVLDRLVEYTRIHFALEESLMRMLHYPGYEEHKQHHEMLLNQVAELVGKVKAGQHVTFELLHFLKNWLTRHIMEEDKIYAPFFLDRGVAATHKKRSWLGRIFHK
ncbi:hemerythrin [Endozoicomonas sp. OPT23]|uniref:bacteriohemerythrin n=1 Tax=Endozoicomonas sp. OPT23 TaxID=2072845 RepID=UPI00129A358A|nr:bacteriohemerythrin [Endozoicomonas sp. OPT23]MRI32538.1 hemerythrin [Endozoicomonas sp. OPT23]